MRFSYVALAGLVGLATAQDFDGARCGAPEPPQALINEANRQLDAEATERAQLFGNINVTTYVHIVTRENSTYNYTQTMVNNQITYMNTYYNPWNISFTLADTDYTVNNNWAAAGAGTNAELNMKRALRQGGYRDLNLYFLSDLGGGLLGFCYFPRDNPTVKQLTLDGCINLAGSLPGGETPRYNLGGTAAHESGHWFGLFHVFQGSASCSGKGDYVSDTAIQSVATRGMYSFADYVEKSSTDLSIPGCPVGQDSCPNKPGLDNIHNIMDYSTDICYNVCDNHIECFMVTAADNL